MIRGRWSGALLSTVMLALSVACTRTDDPAGPQFDPLVIRTSALDPGETGTAYDASLTATGGDGSYAWSVSQGGLPDGLTLAVSGTLSGTPTAKGSFSFTVEVRSGDGQSANVALSLDIAARGPLDPDELCSSSPPGAVVSFTDPNLASRVRAALGIGGSDPVTCAQAATVKSLTADGLGIQSLTGIQNLTGLTSADLQENKIADIAPLAGLASLSSLSLYSNPISDLGPLTGLTSLDVLVLWDVPATDLSPLSTLTSLTFLEFWGSGAPVSDIGAFATLTSLTRLFLEENAVQNVDALSGLTALRDLDLDNNALTDISGIANLPELSRVWLAGNSALADIAALLDNPGIGSGDGVDLRGTAVSCLDVAALAAKGVNVSSDCP